MLPGCWLRTAVQVEGQTARGAQAAEAAVRGAGCRLVRAQGGGRWVQGAGETGWGVPAAIRQDTAHSTQHTPHLMEHEVVN